MKSDCEKRSGAELIEAFAGGGAASCASEETEMIHAAAMVARLIRDECDGSSDTDMRADAARRHGRSGRHWRDLLAWKWVARGWSDANVQKAAFIAGRRGCGWIWSRRAATTTSVRWFTFKWEGVFVGHGWLLTWNVRCWDI